MALMIACDGYAIANTDSLLSGHGPPTAPVRFAAEGRDTGYVSYSVCVCCVCCVCACACACVVCVCVCVCVMCVCVCVLCVILPLAVLHCTQYCINLIVKVLHVSVSTFLSFLSFLSFRCARD